MKKMLFVLLMPLTIYAQNNWLEQNVNVQVADSNHIKAMVSGKAFELMSYAKPDSILTDDIMTLAKSVHGMVGYMELSGSTIDKTLAAAAKNGAFEEYAKITQKSNKMVLYVRQKDGVINEAVMLVKSTDQNMAVSVFGEIDMRLFGQMYKLIPHKYMRELQHDHNHEQVEKHAH